MMKIWNWFISMDVKIQTAIISALVSLILWGAKSLYELIRDKHMMMYKLRTEYEFKQQMSIKEKLATSKTPLIKAAEELNYRLWNFSVNIDKQWHVVEDINALKRETDYYYIKSFLYRFLSFLAWVEKSEKDVYSFDFLVADEEDKIYLKYIKSMKQFFCDTSLLSSLNVDTLSQAHHFFSDQLHIYISYIKDENGNVIPYYDFKKKIEGNPSSIWPVIKYISNTQRTDNNCSYNVFISFHLLLMLFLNKYGLDYHNTDRQKFKKIASEQYHPYLKIGKELLSFFERNMIESEVKWIIEDLKLS